MLCIATLLAGCGEAIDAPDAPDAPVDRVANNQTPYQQVLTLIDAGSRLPAAGDDLTLYLDERFDQRVDPAPAPAPQHASLGDSSQIGL